MPVILYTEKYLQVSTGKFLSTHHLETNVGKEEKARQGRERGKENKQVWFSLVPKQKF